MKRPTRFQLVSLAVVVSAIATLPGQVLTEEQADQWRERIRRTLFVPDPLPPLDAKLHGFFEVDGKVVAERVTYGTQFGMRVPAILYLPRERKGKIPALIIVNGHGGDKYCWYSFYSGVLYAHAGAAVLTYDPAGEGERNPQSRSGTRAHDKLERIPELARRQGGQMMTDLMQAVSYLAQRPEVDPARIAAAGYSMGSFVLALTGGWYPRAGGFRSWDAAGEAECVFSRAVGAGERAAGDRLVGAARDVGWGRRAVADLVGQIRSHSSWRRCLRWCNMRLGLSRQVRSTS